MSPRNRPIRERRLATRIERGLETHASWWERLLELPLLWARRSRFVKRGRPLLVTEVFLPALGLLG